ncbi:D-alanyl-D-alanine carboxypeptidase [Hymenobacter cheonanensis]|uniref:D-alanyl-D-alanine carboxypeptidase n=1 Tax=Hymenobacter sp. CA2-7 TaxID=3063993 RepID=UPI00271299FB|nr:D-alanyl-D-alanine carboxypeptidase [Hymenobacter sp. CA2-7]MDO7885582.1 D-alanyl-D-alanine carboxypeptidase [Hymenobacter sp. CA2-7]
MPTLRISLATFSGPRCVALLAPAVLSLTTACGQTTTPALPPAIVTDSATGKTDMPWLRQQLDSSITLRRQQVGVALADATTGQSLFSYNEGKYFTPASTMKLLSLYTGLTLLPDSLPSLRYFSRGDTLYFQGTGDPTFLHGDVPSRRAYAFLAGRPEKVLAYCDIATVPAYGPGWTWDDFGYYFQPERTAFPVYGNTVRFYAAAPQAVRTGPGAAVRVLPQRVRVAPRQFAPLTERASPDFRLSPDQDDEMHVYRAQADNHFTFVPGPKKWIDEVPYRTSRPLLLRLLGDTLRRAIVGAQWRPHPSRDSLRTLRGLRADSLYRRMLRVSDNFLAEQLLLMTSTRVGYRDSLSSARAIRYMLQHELKNLPDRPDWVDGSGLSRLNLLTPRTLTAVLVRLHQQVPEARLLSLLAAGGGQGTLRKRYFEPGPPKVTWFWGKTGTLTHTCNLAGYVRCKSGRLVAVTFFNNSIPGDDQATRNAMQRLLGEVRARL